MVKLADDITEPAPTSDNVDGSDNHQDYEEYDDGNSSDDWETASLIDDEQLRAGTIPNACTIEEATAFRERLHAIGSVAFVHETLRNGQITAKKLCTAFRIMPPLCLKGEPDSAYHALLEFGMSREISRRPRLREYSDTIEDAVRLIQKSNNIVVVTGAGISTSVGIPDFRSKDTGLYSQLGHLGLSDPQEVFDIELFREDPSIFFSIAKDILPSTKKYSPTHAFIRLLQDKQKLLTNYTQNIDNLEAYAGISRNKLVQCHGSFASASCTKCSHNVRGSEIFDDIRKGAVPLCAECVKELAETRTTKRKRKAKTLLSDDSSDEEYSIPTPGVMKPSITFFGEQLPSSFKDRLLERDIYDIDLLIVIGTSLNVAPVAELPRVIPRSVPQVYISRTPFTRFEFDVNLIRSCDDVVIELCRLLDWELKNEVGDDES